MVDTGHGLKFGQRSIATEVVGTPLTIKGRSANEQREDMNFKYGDRVIDNHGLKATITTKRNSKSMDGHSDFRFDQDDSWELISYDRPYPVDKTGNAVKQCWIGNIWLKHSDGSK